MLSIILIYLFEKQKKVFRTSETEKFIVGLIKSSFPRCYSTNNYVRSPDTRQVFPASYMRSYVVVLFLFEIKLLK